PESARGARRPTTPADRDRAPSAGPTSRSWTDRPRSDAHCAQRTAGRPVCGPRAAEPGRRRFHVGFNSGLQLPCSPGRDGSRTTLSGTWAVTPGQTMTVYVGQSANDATPGGGAAAGADAGCSAAGGGGGASSVQIDGAVAAVAAGGGGGGAQGIFPGAD